MSQPQQLVTTCTDEIELERQYLEYLKQFELWKDKNRNHPDQSAYNAYVEQWKTWESQVQQRRQVLRQMKLQQQSGAGTNPKTTSALPQAGSQLSSAVGQLSTNQQQVQQSASVPGSVSASDMMNFMQQMQLMNQMFMNPMSIMMMNMNPLAPPPNFPSASQEVSSKPLMEAFASMMGVPPQPQQPALAGNVDSQSPEVNKRSSSKKEKEKDRKERKKKRKHNKEGKKRRKLSRSRSRSSSRSKKQSRSKSHSQSRSPSPPAVPAVRNWDRILDMEKHLDPDLKEKLRVKRSGLDFFSEASAAMGLNSRSKPQTVATDFPPPNSADTLVPRATSTATTSFRNTAPTLAGFDFSRPPPGLLPLPTAHNTLPTSAGRPTFPPPPIGHLPTVSASFSSPASNLSRLPPPRLNPSILGVAPPPKSVVTAGHPRINPAVLGIGVAPASLKPSLPPNRAYAGFAEARTQVPSQPRRFPPLSPAVATATRLAAARAAAANVQFRMNRPQGQLRQPAPVQQRRPPPMANRMQSPRQPMLNKSLPSRSQQATGAAAVAADQRPKPLLGIKLGRFEPAWKNETTGQASSKQSSGNPNDDDDEGLCSDQDE